MQIELRHQPSFGVARLHLAPGESVEAESGAMAMHSPGISISSQAKGGVMKSLMRSTLGGESLFISTFTADPQYAGWVDVAANLPGDVSVIDVTPEVPWCITRGSWLANSPTVDLETSWGGSKMFFSGEGGFIVRAVGQGEAVVACYGAMDIIDLQPGQWFTVDTGHLVAFQASAQTNLRKASQGGMMQSLKSGEGLVMDVQGPGRVITQSRNPSGLVSWLTANGLGSRG